VQARGAKSIVAMSDWYYSEAGQQKGPVSEEQLAALLESGTLAPSTLVWTDGMAEWRAVATISKPISPLPPPPPLPIHEPPAVIHVPPAPEKHAHAAGVPAIDPREQRYFVVALVVSILVWLVCVATVTPLIYVGGMALFMWLANGLLVAELEANAVKVDSDQLPELAATLARACARLKVSPAPELYILQSNGLLNAFATRHCGRSFVVVFSEMLEAYGPASPEMEFLLGHELGHIKRNHLLKRLLLAPGCLLPLLGNAYSRACELTCDRHGAIAAANGPGAMSAMMVLAGGRQAGKMMAARTFADQYAGQRGFFVSWYELISGYPTLSQRVANLIALREGRTLEREPRSLLSYLFALFTVGGRGGGGTQMLLTVAIVAVLASSAGPAMERMSEQASDVRRQVRRSMPLFGKARARAQEAACMNNLRWLAAAREQVLFERTSNPSTVVSMEEAWKSLGGQIRKCPKGGQYTFDEVDGEPSCSVHGKLPAP
jgi:Zn-dependent protease with chaperone function